MAMAREKKNNRWVEGGAIIIREVDIISIRGGSMVGLVSNVSCNWEHMRSV